MSAGSGTTVAPVLVISTVISGFIYYAADEASIAACWMRCRPCTSGRSAPSQSTGQKILRYYRLASLSLRAMPCSRPRPCAPPPRRSSSQGETGTQDFLVISHKRYYVQTLLSLHQSLLQNCMHILHILKHMQRRPCIRCKMMQNMQKHVHRRSPPLALKFASASLSTILITNGQY